ncbi:chemokine-like protein TAFA-5 isoform X1 [Ahaetulla prasina]|uniref:chemokine-like protein TAFA-5 isoform X1 n=1 Tax=Ahaetulla prasina TaxID=499056 RepID=UPI002649EA73|nr:chemokine-like protein TAFA-5 isoform X1 [Ahaetulla prasina]
MLAGWRELSTRISAILGCLLFFWLLYCHLPKEGKELEVGTCEITALDRDMSHPKRMIARQTARCACRRGQVAGTTKAKPACVDGFLTSTEHCKSTFSISCVLMGKVQRSPHREKWDNPLSQYGFIPTNQGPSHLYFPLCRHIGCRGY